MDLNLFKTGRLFDKLVKNPNDAGTKQDIQDFYQKHPVRFIVGFIEAVTKTIKDDKEEKQQLENPEEKFRRTWENTVHKERVQPLLYLTPAKREQIAPIVKRAEEMGVMVRAVGKGHSFSDVANATDVLVSMLNMDNALPLETDTLNAAGAGKSLYSCEAGTMVSKLNADLDALGLAIPTMAAFDQETIYGAVATSTHGTGIRVPGMTDMIMSMDICAAGGKWYRLEPTNGITDPTKFAAKYPNGEITLIQDDDKYHSSVVGFGMMGIVYSVVIETVKTFYLEQRLWLTNWTDVQVKMKNGSFFIEIDPNGDLVAKDPVTQEYLPTRAQVFVNPYITKKIWDGKMDHTCVVQIQTEITKAEYNAKVAAEPDKPMKVLEAIESILSNGTKGSHVETTSQEDKTSILAEMSTDVILAFMNAFPEFTPTLIDISMAVLLTGSGKIGKSFEVMNQGKLAFKDAGYSVEPGFKVDPQLDYLTGANEILRVAGLSQQGQAYLTSPSCLRFVKSSPEYMSPEYNVDTCMIDVPLLLGTIGDDQMLDRMQLDIIPKGARPHWGKICNLVNGSELIGQMYPKFDTFKATVQFFNPHGTFNSTFSYRTGMSTIDYLPNG